MVIIMGFGKYLLKEWYMQIIYVCWVISFMSFIILYTFWGDILFAYLFLIDMVSGLIMIFILAFYTKYKEYKKNSN